MSKAEIAALEKVWAHEIDRAVGPKKHGFPFQSKAAIYKRLVAGGLLEARTVMHGAPPLSVRIEGYELTHAGRLLYCLSCESDEATKEAPVLDDACPYCGGRNGMHR